MIIIIIVIILIIITIIIAIIEGGSGYSAALRGAPGTETAS
jgi:hypothetical protein